MAEHYLKGAEWSLVNDSFEYGGVLDENGSADLDSIALGEYTFTLSKEGYETRTQEVVVGNGPIDIQVYLEKIPEPEPEPEEEDEAEEKPKKKSSKKKTTKKSSKKDDDKAEEKKTTSKKTTKKSTKKSSKKIETKEEEPDSKEDKK